jgi:S-adenosylmethionine:tRNA ribosyltransferase-isomerase
MLDVRGQTVRRSEELADVLKRGDLIVVNDAATWPASLRGTVRGRGIEIRLTTGAFGPGEVVLAVAFGDGDWRTRTEDRAAPPAMIAGDVIAIEGIELVVAQVRHPRLVEVMMPRDDAGIRALFAAGRPVQYAHLARELAPWDVATAYGGRPWAVEMPSAGRPLSWRLLRALEARGVRVAAITHAAGLSSTGDLSLDATLPWRERYDIPAETADLIAATRARRGRVIAIGTTVVRALETAVRSSIDGGVAAGEGATDLILTAAHRRRVVDGIVSGLHDPHESHFRLLQAFAPRAALLDGWRLARAHGLRGHELGDLQIIV